ncbi:hypothetical protein B0H15DRAFT_188850 [Mycena belliarum]|uniref:Uncharacterized protein n=1 Tax=Mycena belliarum TaxID=1033014 RepID=A0AAD6UL77_9AGAR|nr:hypothetical protein B0H15DRAFT_188850 [Mycena belliae]
MPDSAPCPARVRSPKSPAWPPFPSPRRAPREPREGPRRSCSQGARARRRVPSRSTPSVRPSRPTSPPVVPARPRSPQVPFRSAMDGGGAGLCGCEATRARRPSPSLTRDPPPPRSLSRSRGGLAQVPRGRPCTQVASRSRRRIQRPSPSPSRERSVPFCARSGRRLHVPAALFESFPRDGFLGTRRAHPNPNRGSGPRWTWGPDSPDSGLHVGVSVARLACRVITHARILNASGVYRAPRRFVAGGSGGRGGWASRVLRRRSPDSPESGLRARGSASWSADWVDAAGGVSKASSGSTLPESPRRSRGRTAAGGIRRASVVARIVHILYLRRYELQF